mmetsp:Transcript_2923/g.7727  ORF Transcript_2923/g.7727 Transcript_2923/m.7727 type:complete len:189 (+) Transcript_2923:74-640(+)|eukprot:jgi/Tetstr1/465155/TSEL_009877.t1
MPPLLGAWAASVLFFHGSEFLLAVRYQRDDLSWKSLLLSRDYGIAMMASLAEYAIELTVVPSLKSLKAVSYCGIAMVVAGEAIRKTGMITAQENFTHSMRFEKHDGHKLVCHGIYRYIRHPGYLGWFIWSIGTQVMLCNPCCAVMFAIVSFKFFQARIEIEEHYLERFFGEQYRQYAERTKVWIPFIP